MFRTNALRSLALAVAFTALAVPDLFTRFAGGSQAMAQQGAPAPTPGPAPAPGPGDTKAPETPAEPSPEAATVTPIEIPERQGLMLRGKAKWDEGFKSITDAFSQLRAEADKAKLTTAGRPLAIFVQSDDDGFTFEALLPLENPPAADAKFANGVTASKSPGGQGLKFEHRGAYDDIESTYEAIAAYLDEKGLSARDELIEEFVNETVGSDDTGLSVDIYVLLKP